MSAIPALAKVAASGEGAERDAARDTLARLRGPGVREALLKDLASAEPPEKAELLRALGERGDTAAADVLVRNAAAGPDAVRLAALESLRKLAVPAPSHRSSTSPAKPSRMPSAKRRSRRFTLPARPARTRTRPPAVSWRPCRRMTPAERRQVLPVLSELGTPGALEAAQAATRDPDPELVKEAVRALALWPNAAPAAGLLELARTSTVPAIQVLAVRGCIEVAAQEPDAARRLRSAAGS